MLLFPVKLGPRGRAVLLAFAVASCGYRSAVDGAVVTTGSGSVSVAAAPMGAPHPEALESALAGARAELGRVGALGGRGFPRLVVELVRVDEVATGMAAIPRGGEDLPLARGSSVGVVVRAWLERAPGASPARDSGDVRRVDVVVQRADVAFSSAAFRAAVRGAARRAGEAATRRALGRAEPSVEPM